MTATATLTSKGQITVPKPVRKSLGVSAGDLILFEREADGSFHIKPASRKSKLEGLLHPYLPKNFKPPTIQQIKKGIAGGANRGRFGK